jgi:hypothetical protein
MSGSIKNYLVRNSEQKSKIAVENTLQKPKKTHQKISKKQFFIISCSKRVKKLEGKFSKENLGHKKP